MKKELFIKILCFAIILFGGLSASTTMAATRTVDNLTDDNSLNGCTNAANDCSLRGATNFAASGDTINFDATIFNVSRQISASFPYNINQNITINGPGINLLTVRPTSAVSNFIINPGATLNISGMSIACSISNGGGSNGGGFYNNGGTLNATNVLVTQCAVTQNGGGIYNDGELNLINSSVSGNTASQNGGGIYNNAGRTAIINNSTITNNSATIGGGGIYNTATLNVQRSTISSNSAVSGGGVRAGQLSVINSSTMSGNWASFAGGAVAIGTGERLDTTNTTVTTNSTGTSGFGSINNNGLYQTRNSIIAGNSNNGGGTVTDISGTVTSFGYNLIGNTNGANIVSSGLNGQTLDGNLLNVPANLLPLGNYGGPTLTHALLPNSPAVNAGDPTNSFNTDQRGALRPSGGRGDIGAFEQNITLNPTTLPNGFQAAPYNQTLTATRLTSIADFLTPQKIEFLNSDPLFAPFTFSIIPLSGQGLPPGLTLSTGGVLSGTPTTVGSFTFTVQTTDSDGIAGVQQYTISIGANTVPTISGAIISRQQGSPVANSTIATVNDAQSGANGVTVSISTANPSNGVTVSNIVNTNGTVTADVIADCSAANASFSLRATDTVGATATSTLTVNVSVNTAPTLVYPAMQIVSSGSFINVSPTAATDNGAVSYSIVSVLPALTTAPTVDPNGVVSITNAQPLGDHVITVRSTDICGSTTDANFTLTVVSPTRIVTKTDDTADGICDADCSLREAIATASPNDMIEFASPLFDTAQTITLTFGQLYIYNSLTVNGKGPNLLTINGNNQDRVLAIDGNAHVTVNGLTITGGRDFFNGISNRYGGGVFNYGTFTLNNSVVSGNNVTSGGSDSRFGGRGGGIYNDDNAVMTINNSTISGNSNTSASNSFAYGGGIYNANGTLTINSSTIAGNSSSSNIPNFGGGIFNGGTLVMTNSTVSGNSLSNNGFKKGGGIYNSHTATLINNTITLNSITNGGSSEGGGIYQIGTMNAVNTILSGNTSANTPELWGAFNANTNNFISGNPLLGPLADNGGPTQTHALLTGSLAINAGSNCVLTANGCGIGNSSFPNDQRGTSYPRLAGAAVDIGAFEKGLISGETVSLQAGSPISNMTIASIDDFETNAVITVSSANPLNNVTVSNIVNTNGTVTADVFAACGATNASFTLRATDSGGATTTTGLTVNVSGNTPPTVVYPTLQAVAIGDSLNVATITAIDNGTIVSFTIVSVSPGLTNAPTINSNGIVSITNAQGLGNHVITVRSTDNCGLTTDSSFTLIVGDILSVTKTADTNDGICDSDCSLREAINTSTSGDTIRFASPLFDVPQTITLGSGQLSINKILTINGKGANLTTVSANGASRVFNNSGTLTLNGLTVVGGFAPQNSGGGGGILNSGAMIVNNCDVSQNSSDLSNGGGINNTGTMKITGSTISNNIASGYVASGAGISNSGVMMIVNSTISSNVLDIFFSGSGGGIRSVYSLTLINSTVTLNTTINTGSGGGISGSGTLNAVNTIISGNSSAHDPDLNGTLGINLNSYIGGDAMLAPLALNGGPTKTHAPLTGSPAINAGDNCVLTEDACGINNPALTTDQRGAGFPRLRGTLVEIGAFELTENSAPTVAGSTISRQQGSSVSNSTIATVNDAESGANGVTVTITTANPSNGVTVSNIVNANGTVTADVIADCSATSSGFTLTATDNDGATATSTLTVNVSVDTAPTLAYPTTQNVGNGNSINVFPTAASDNGTVSYSIFSVSPTLTTAPTVDSNGVVSITNAQPTGKRIITVRATDNCGLTTDESFTLNVSSPTRTVTKTADTDDGVCDTDCSLREAIAAANPGDLIVFSALFNSPQTITLGGQLIISRNLTINGTGANLLTVSGNNASRVFQVLGNINLTVRGVTITGGQVTDADGGGILSYGNLTLDSVVLTGNQLTDPVKSGGGIYTFSGSLNITNSTISNNSAARGGAVSTNGRPLTVSNTTFSGNIATGDTGNFTGGGGAIFGYNSTVYLTNSTFSGNSAANGNGGAIKAGGNSVFVLNNSTIANNNALNGGGIYSESGGLPYHNLKNTIISGNMATNDPDVSGDFSIGIYENNLVGNRGASTGFSGTGNQIGTSGAPINTKLAPLGNYGGTTQTHALLADSPAVNAGDNCVLTANGCGTNNPALTADQRGTGAPRIIGAFVDIGAFEANITFDQSSLPNAYTGVNYSQQLAASRNYDFDRNDFSAESPNLVPATFEIVAAAGQQLPPGIDLSAGGSLSGMPTTTGNYIFTVKATDTDGMAGAQQFVISVFGPTAANVSVAGRVTTAAGSGLSNAIVVIMNSGENNVTTRTNSFGYYKFNDIAAGETYIISVLSKEYTFAPQVITATEDLSGINFTAQQ